VPPSPGSVVRALPGSLLGRCTRRCTHSPALDIPTGTSLGLTPSQRRRRQRAVLGRPQELKSLGRFGRQGGQDEGEGVESRTRGGRKGGAGSQGPRAVSGARVYPWGAVSRSLGHKGRLPLHPLGRLPGTPTAKAPERAGPGSDSTSEISSLTVARPRQQRVPRGGCQCWGEGHCSTPQWVRLGAGTAAGAQGSEEGGGP